jgi:hypothetical protein
MSETFSLFWARWPLIMGVVFVVVIVYLRGGIVELIGKVHGRIQQAQEAS